MFNKKYFGTFTLGGIPVLFSDGLSVCVSVSVCVHLSVSQSVCLSVCVCVLKRSECNAI